MTNTYFVRYKWTPKNPEGMRIVPSEQEGSSIIEVDEMQLAIHGLAPIKDRLFRKHSTALDFDILQMNKL